MYHWSHITYNNTVLVPYLATRNFDDKMMSLIPLIDQLCIFSWSFCAKTVFFQQPTPVMVGIAVRLPESLP
jgi:hypothetical protein